MNNERILEKALETLEKAASEKPATAQRLEALAKVISNIPWNEVATLSIGWDRGEYIVDGKDVVEFLPTLDVVMKEQMS